MGKGKNQFLTTPINVISGIIRAIPEKGGTPLSKYTKTLIRVLIIKKRTPYMMTLTLINLLIKKT